MVSSTAKKKAIDRPAQPDVVLDWRRIAHLLHLSRAIDAIEVERLLPEKKVLYQFSAGGHELGQLVLGSLLTGRHDAVSGYYRSRPLLLALGLSPEDALASSMGRDGGFSAGRDIGVVFNYPNDKGATALPMSGGVGAQYTPIVGWAQAIRYRHEVLGEAAYAGAIAVAHGGDGSAATNGFWAALNIATTQRLPMLFYIEDNGYGISTPSHFQSPGANIAANLASYQDLLIHDGDGTDPVEVASILEDAVAHVRAGKGPALVRLTVPRLSGHSAQDTQAYKNAKTLAAEKARDPLPRLIDHLASEHGLSADEWGTIESEARKAAEQALAAALERPMPDPGKVAAGVFHDAAPGGCGIQVVGGLAAEGLEPPKSSSEPNPEATRINMLTAIRRTLEFELSVNDRVVIFGEDVGPKGGVHGATLGLQDKFGDKRIFDTSLSEEGIVGRAVGMALAGLMPVPEIQFRKYADPAEEQLNDCGTMRWRTNNRFAAPMVVRIPGGFFKCGDPWHSQTGEVKWAHAVGWRLAVPSNAEDAVGLLRGALRGNDPTIFFEHRAMLDDSWARRPYPGDGYVLPFGKARTTRPGGDLSVITWGAMVPRCEAAAEKSGAEVEVIDLRTLMPWDREAILASVRKTRRCLIVHEDNGTAGFGAEIAAVLASEAFFDLDAPIERLTMPDIPSPHNPILLEAAVPSVDAIAEKLVRILET